MEADFGATDPNEAFMFSLIVDFLTLLGLWSVMKYRERTANTSYHSLLPCYSLLFLFFTVITCFELISSKLLGTDTFVVMILSIIRGVSIDSWTVLVYQPGVGRKALITTAKLMIPQLGLYGACTAIVLFAQETQLIKLVQILAHALRCLGYGSIFGSTFCSSRIPLFRRRTIRIYTVILGLEAAYVAAIDFSSLQFSLPVSVVILSSLATARNVVLYWAMVRDTRYWLNDLDENEMEEVNLEVQTSSTDIRRPILGLSLEDGAGRMIGRQFDKFEPRDVIGHAELSLNMSQLIGHGGVSKVFSGMCRGEAVAIKLLFVPEISRRTVKTFFHEAAFLRSLSSHPNMVQLRGICVAPPALCHVLELCDGNVQSLITERRRKLGAGLGRSRECDEVFLSLGLQCSRAVAFLHSRAPPIIHRDIKSLNFLFIRRQSTMDSRTDRSEFVVKLTDMDLALIYEGDGDDQRALPTGQRKYSSFSSMSSKSADGFCGTPQWASPEIFRGESNGDVKSDVYSLLVVLWELLTLESPFEGIDRRELGDLIGREAVRLPIPDGIPLELRQLFKAGWSENPNDRPSADTIVSVLTSLSKDDLTREREEMLNLGLLMFDPNHVTIREICEQEGEGRRLWKCAMGGDLMKYLMSSDQAQQYLLKTQDSSSKTLDPVAAVALLCQKLLDKGLIQAVYEKRFGPVGRSMRGRGMKSNPMIGLKFMTTTMYSLNTNLRHGEMSSLTDLAQSFHIS